MEINSNGRKKRKSSGNEEIRAKRAKEKENQDDEKYKAGKVKRVVMRNFMCHDALEVELNPNVNFIVGHNGSGKSAILTALTVGLGAKAHVTSRGNSLKGFIKKGKQTASVEVTLYNSGCLAYKPEVFGNHIIVCRSIGSSSSYKIKNWKGEVVSKKKCDLDNILQAFNIQINNPISILNQDISRTFLVASKPEEKYELFMKATLLDIIGNNYKSAEITCKNEYEKLKQYNELLSEARKEVEKLRHNIKRAEEIDKSKEEVKELEKELQWAAAVVEEKKLERCRQQFEKCESNFKEIQGNESSFETKCKEIDAKIKELEEQIGRSEKEVSDSTKAYNQAKEDYSTLREQHSGKSREWRTIQSRVKRLEDDKATIRKEIHRLENGDSKEQYERNQFKQQLTDVEQKLDDVEAMLRMKQTDQMHFQADKMRFVKERQSAKIEVDSWNYRIDKMKRELHALKSRSGNAMTVFGTNIPRLLRRIEEEFRNKKFLKMPRGPLGAYIKVKDSKWAPAVENYLSAGLLTGFCVDNNRDAKQLLALMKEVYINEVPPQIMCSKFYENVHNVNEHCTRSPHYSNLLEAMEISDPVVANCLIDQSEVETVLLIPTSKEASEIMSDARRVPKNCKRAFTCQADTFYPDPRYRSYGGPRGLRSKFLQTSTKDAIQGLEEELRSAEDSRASAMQVYTAIIEREKQNNIELDAVNAKVLKLRAMQDQHKSMINDLRDKLEANECLDIQVFKNELTELEKKVQTEKAEESRLEKIVLEYQKKVEQAEAEVKRYRELRQTLDAKVNPLKENIRQLQEGKETIRMRTQHANRKLTICRQALQNATAEFETQQRVSEKAVSDAEKLCQRIDTERSPKEIDRLLRDLKSRIAEIERQFGTIDQLRKELKQKEAKYGKNLALAERIEKNYEAQLQRLKHRKQSYQDMKLTYAVNIKNSFSSVLALRKKKGNIHIDHTHKTLELEVIDMNDKKRPTNDARSLSGGERSYSTVAFILALWDCTGLPFYFLDEFDVFMDKVNRRVIMDILLDHTKSHPQSQFTFLTPLDTSHILAEDYVTIHRLAPPERRRSNATQVDNE